MTDMPEKLGPSTLGAPNSAPEYPKSATEALKGALRPDSEAQAGHATDTAAPDGDLTYPGPLNLIGLGAGAPCSVHPRRTIDAHGCPRCREVALVRRLLRQMDELMLRQPPGVPADQMSIYRVQCAAITRGCQSALVLDAPRNVDVGNLDPQVPEDARVASLLHANGWRVDHGRWVCGLHGTSATAAAGPPSMVNVVRHEGLTSELFVGPFPDHEAVHRWDARRAETHGGTCRSRRW